MPGEIATEIVGGASAPAEDTGSTVESTENTPAVEDTNSVDMSARFAALSRKEKSIREAQEANKANTDKYSKFADLETLAKSNPSAVMEQYGITLDDLIAASLGGDAPAPSVEDQITALREELAQSKKDTTQKELDNVKAQEEAHQASVDEAILTYQNDITDHLGQNVERYELINLQGAQDLVWQVTEAHFEANNGEILTPEQASDKVEEYLEGQVRKAMELNRFKKTQEVDVGGIFKTEAQPNEPTQRSTLTSELIGTAPEKQSNSGLTLDESKTAAASLLKWT